MDALQVPGTGGTDPRNVHYLPFLGETHGDRQKKRDSQKNKGPGVSIVYTVGLQS